MRILALTSSADGTRLDIVGPEGARYRLRIGKAIDGCTQTLGAVDPTPRRGLPPNAVRNAVIDCATGGDRDTIVKTGAVLVTVAAGSGFTADVEVPLARDIKLRR